MEYFWLEPRQFVVNKLWCDVDETVREEAVTVRRKWVPIMAMDKSVFGWQHGIMIAWWSTSISRRRDDFWFEPRWFVVNKFWFGVAETASDEAAKAEVLPNRLIAHTMTLPYEQHYLMVHLLIFWRWRWMSDSELISD